MNHFEQAAGTFSWRGLGGEPSNKALQLTKARRCLGRRSSRGDRERTVSNHALVAQRTTS